MELVLLMMIIKKEKTMIGRHVKSLEKDFSLLEQQMRDAIKVELISNRKQLNVEEFEIVREMNWIVKKLVAEHFKKSDPENVFNGK